MYDQIIQPYQWIFGVHSEYRAIIKSLQACLLTVKATIDALMNDLVKLALFLSILPVSMCASSYHALVRW